MQQTTLTRRGILAGTALAALAGANVTATRALAGGVDPDARLLSLFRQWEQAQRDLQAMAPSAEDDEFDAAMKASDAIVMEMTPIPATGAVGRAVKSYILAHMLYSGTRADYTAIDLPETENEHGGKVVTMLRSILADAASLGIGAHAAHAAA